MCPEYLAYDSHVKWPRTQARSIQELAVPPPANTAPYHERQEWGKSQVKMHLAMAAKQQAYLDWHAWGIGHGLLDEHRPREDASDWLAMPEQTRLQQLQRRLTLNNAIDVLETMCIERYMEIQKCSKPQTGEYRNKETF
jgi:hypothetical protein